MADTRTKLLDAALETLKKQGMAGVSARTIATAAGVNQALVFYHFGSVDQLLAAAVERGCEQRMVLYRERFAAVTTLRELLDLGRAIHEEERAEGSVAALAQLLAGSQTDSKLAPAVVGGLNLWIGEVEQALGRVLATSPLAEFADVSGLAKATAAAFVGLELYEGVDTDGAAQALDALEELAVLVTALEDMGPMVRRVVRARLTRSIGPRSRSHRDRESK
ncbi:TetR/AcrR family transcriptional regulator [Nonomuraea fuscirosea]|uniref:TetR family transcriptional regulator n=1 Tax=Nonomuraea fuscirosea TaxID=1291556 RepID=A0A2T0MSA2_9ACTN|nr:TetR/AcrR family transcriptional regulator [Nonomuraea fuscirosea]PRX61366.1 TetR family transcriptional regulator [Nonomuraea fuscirosea]